MENENIINMEINNAENKKTPEYDKNIIEFKGEIISLDTHAVNIILNEISTTFVLEDFSKNETEIEVLDYFYTREKKILEEIDVNFKDNQTQLFLKSQLTQFIEQKYKSNQSLSYWKNSIDGKINEILEKINKYTDIDTFNLSEEYWNHFGTDEIPKFLEKNIVDEIETLKLIKEFNQQSENNNLFDKKEYNFKEKQKDENLMEYYSQFLDGSSFAFDGGDQAIIFMILLYCNLKYIYRSKMVKDIFINNIYEICNYLNYLEGIVEFDEEINNKKDFRYIDEKLESIFKRYEYNDFHLFIIASYFYFVLNRMEDKNINENMNKKRNNLNNPIMVQILINILKGFAKYCPNEDYTLETYIYLFNYFKKYMLEADKSEKINRQYEIEDIEMKIKGSNNKEFKKEFDSQYKEILNIEKKRPFSKNLNNLIRLIIKTWKNFFNFDKENSDYYMFRWPSSDTLTFVFKILAHLRAGFESFELCYNKAECAGKILALFLMSNEEFHDCQINLVGFSLGCHVVMNCLKELNEFKEHNFIINNVLLMGGATVIEDSKINLWKNIFRDNVAGRIINCYSKCDNVLKYLFPMCMRKSPIGLDMLNLNDENNDYSINEDYDFSDIRLGHLDYRDKFKIILKRIKFFNWN